MTREQLIEAIEFNLDEWSCPQSQHYCKDCTHNCEECAERILKEYEQKICETAYKVGYNSALLLYECEAVKIVKCDGETLEMLRNARRDIML